jgi:hypothetical protein
MVRIPSDHPYGSARAYRWGEGPDWLSRDEVERVVRTFFEKDEFEPEDIDAFASAVDDEITAYLIERSLRSPSAPLPPLADLVRTASAREQSWMAWKAHLADGSRPGAAFLTPDAVNRAARVAERMLARRPHPSGRSSVRRDLEAGLLRHASGLTLREISERLGLAVSAVHTALRRHERRLEDCPAYGELTARLLRRSVRRFLTRGHLPGVLAARVGLGQSTVEEIPFPPTREAR